MSSLPNRERPLPTLLTFLWEKERKGGGGKGNREHKKGEQEKSVRILSQWGIDKRKGKHGGDRGGVFSYFILEIWRGRTPRRRGGEKGGQRPKEGGRKRENESVWVEW